MSSDKRFVNKLPERVRREDTPGVRIDSGPFIGIIKNNNDPIRSGRLQVWIPDLGGEEGNPQNWRTVAYASPFAGVTYQPNTSKNNKFSEVQHSYGMWAVPPDIGNQVICLFINGDANRGYWFACVNPNLSHHMVPGLAGSTNVDNSQTEPTLKNKFNTAASNWPVAEFNENNQANIKPGWSNNLKPVHEFQANVLIQQGLDRDTIRGAIKSSSQRESPSTVFGISTPGRPINDPMENPSFESKLKAGTLTEADYAVRGRKGGHTFVMDDGEQMGSSQLMRLRTAGGHQLLMNDSDRIVYLANSDGSVWLEFTGAGFINLYSSSGINLRTEGDFNIHSDKNVNINANDSIKMKAGNLFATESKDWYAKSTSKIGMHTGKFNLLVNGALSMQSAGGNWNAGSKLVLKGDKILLNTETPGAVPEVPTLKTFKQADTSWDPARGLWLRKDEVYESISPIAPSHEPWLRGAGKGVKPADMDAPAPQPEKSTSTCLAPPPPSVTKPGIAPTGVDGESLIVSALQQAGKTDPVLIASILAQCAHESGNFKFLKELGNDSYFAKYEGRKDLGNTQPGDGLKYKGRGYIQITGRDLYDKAGKYLGLDLINNPALAEDPVTAAKLVVYFFFEYKKGRTGNLNWDDVTAVTRVVNGGTNGLKDRESKYAVYKQKYASGVVTTGTGATVVDGSGSPVQTGSSQLDPGPESAKGQTVEKPAPASKMSVQGAPAPGGITAAGPKIPGLIPTQLKALMVQIGFAESGCDYTALDTTLGRIGYYKFNGILLRDYGYIKKDYLSKYEKDAILRDDAWTGKDGITGPDSFKASSGLQNALMETILNDYYKALTKNRGIFLDDDVCTVAGMLAVAYFLRDSERRYLVIGASPPDQAKFWRDQGDTITNKQQQSCNTPYNQGRYAIDVLSIATVASTPTAVPPGPVPVPDSSGIDPDSVFNFTGPTGTRESFNQLDATFKTAILKMAKDYKAITGKKVTIASAFRSQADQERLYATWQAAGGVIPGRPTAAGITTPAKPVSLGGTLNSHGKGQAIDCGQQAVEINNTLNLAQYGLRWGGTFGVPDRVHIQLA